MTQEPDCYAVRRLNPFQGTTQVVELGEARALSQDGIRWDIQVRCAQPEHTWRSSNQGQPVMRYLRFGAWSREAGLRRVPVSPILDLDLMFGESAALMEVLPACADSLPFPLVDRYELWLLDAQALPFALLASSVPAPRPEMARPGPWSAGASSDHGFQSPCSLQRGSAPRNGHDPRHRVSLLERLVRDTAGQPERKAWFERVGEAQCAGVQVSADRSNSGEGPRRLASGDFPPLLLREDWPEPGQVDLVRDYLNWRAPFLLTLPGLEDRVRDGLEQAARERALEVEALHRLYPKPLNLELLKAIRVEARLRAAHQALR